MAKQDSIFIFTGRLGNLVGYTRGNEHFARIRPQSVQQTEGTRRAAQRFGAASRKGSLIRNAFHDDLDVRNDGSHGNRLTRSIIRSGRNNHGELAGFRFSKFAETDKFFLSSPTFTKDGKLLIPPQQLHRFKGINQLEIKLIAARIDFATQRVTGTDASMLFIDMRKPFEGGELSVDIPGEGTLMVTLQIRGFKDGYVTGDRKYLAADIIAVADANTKVITRTQAHPEEILYQIRLQLQERQQITRIVHRE